MRDLRIDAARGLLIIGVVVGHFWENIDGWHHESSRLALTALYSVHMPAFVFLTGLVASPRNLARKVAGLVSLLCVFQILFLGFNVLIGKSMPEWYWPYWVLWFIMAMIWWQLLMPLIARWPLIIFLTACIGAILIGFVDVHGNWFTYQRAFVFLPFYVAGYAWGKRLLDAIQRAKLWLKLILAVAFCGSVAVIFVWSPDPHWLFHNWTYSQLDIGHLRGPAIRGLVLCVGAVGALLVLSLVNQRSASLTWLGARTLPVFLFHAFVVLLFAQFVQPGLGDVTQIARLIGVSILGVMIAYLCAARPLVFTANMVRSLPERLGFQGR